MSPLHSAGEQRRREELRDFLRSRRARLTPEEVGMPGGGRRRTPGLRREEVAVLAGVGVSWYTWLEQGRDIQVSGDVLDAVSRALRLGAMEREHLYLLAGLNPPPREAGDDGQPLREELLRVLEAWSPRPAYVLDRHWNFAAVNDAARAVFGYADEDRNCLIAFFTSPRHRAAFRDWAAGAPGVVRQFRWDMARYPDDPEFGRLAAHLSESSPEFAALWAEHEVGETAQGVKVITHPEVGELVFEFTGVPVPGRPDHRLLLHNPQPGTGTEEKLTLLVRQVRLAG
ncbi:MULTISPECIES: helix-turn-helix transcriptional regulator [Nonomuraea]|uniref:helix-turn-helix transcriptional regulator n=1 Tax=Nonomuraea TaxID=83681 RepID=UPI001C5F1DC1|nr:helix-turn-helix transcriptional regulator [Nonomuraea ceibae]